MPMSCLTAAKASCRPSILKRHVLAYTAQIYAMQAFCGVFRLSTTQPGQHKRRRMPRVRRSRTGSLGQAEELPFSCSTTLSTWRTPVR
jgi:hypothetical protein